MLREDYERESQMAVEQNSKFWEQKAQSFLSWSRPFTKIHSGKFGEDRWFEDGELNACYNCIDRWVESCPDKKALIFNNNWGETIEFTYREAQERILEIANELKHLEPGDAVTLYLAMSPEAVFTALACARLGLTHSAVFGGFSAESLKLRIVDSRSKMLITQDCSFRGDKIINLIQTAVKATAGMDIKVLVFDSNTEKIKEKGLKMDIPESFMKWSSVKKSREFVSPVSVNSEHPLFYLYTSGSTGLPKGLIHSTGGYLLYAAYTLSVAFETRKDDIFCCTADIGWITGHSYCIYGPLALGITSVILEGVPVFPSYNRFFEIVEKYKITQLYTAPTVVRILKAHFDKNPLETGKYDLSSLRYLGSVGEPINKEAYRFFSLAFGGIHVVDTYFQTETGGIMIAPIPGVQQGRPECAALPIPGIVPLVHSEDQETHILASESRVSVNEIKNTEIFYKCSKAAKSPENSGDSVEFKGSNSLDSIENASKNDSMISLTSTTASIFIDNIKTNQSTGLGKVYFAQSWPGIARSILNDGQRYKRAYFEHGIYFTGDEGQRDEGGDFWILGRADDVINVSGHRISTAEVESAACTCPLVSEAAIIALNHEIKGQSMILFVVLKNEDVKFEEAVKQVVSVQIGSFAKPERVIAVQGIPKTATGKIMRRVLRSIVSGKEVGDLSTCVNKEVVESIRGHCKKLDILY